jgi:DNA-binding NtrC family response regulator
MTLWLHFLHQTQPLCGAALRAALEQAGFGVETGAPAGAGKASCGIVVFRQIDATLLALLREIPGDARVLAVALVPGPGASAGPFSAAASWSVIRAGAADLLCWPLESTDGAPDLAENDAGNGGMPADGASAFPPAGTAFNADSPGQHGLSRHHLDCLLARLRRWDALDKLMASPAVRGAVIGDSAAWTALVRSVVEVAAFTRATVLITGETGTGKDLLAQLIHRLGGGGGEPVVVDCTTLSPELSGSELFGHEKGAFTGASAARDGAFALADGGVLFLDEVGELPLPLQAQLLRAVQERQYKRIGSNTWQRADFRLVCATHRDLEAGIAAGQFRADLYYRIAGWRCRTPPLRERRGDILPLARHFLAMLAPPGHFSRAGDGEAADMDAAVREFLLTRDYPGNVRELRQTVTRIWHRHSGPGPLTLGDLPPDDRPPAHADEAAWPDAAFEEAIAHALALGVGLARIAQAAGDAAVRLALGQEAGNNLRAARRLGISARALQLRRKVRATPANGAAGCETGAHAADPDTAIGGLAGPASPRKGHGPG